MEQWKLVRCTKGKKYLKIRTIFKTGSFIEYDNVNFSKNCAGNSFDVLAGFLRGIYETTFPNSTTNPFIR